MKSRPLIWSSKGNVSSECDGTPLSRSAASGRERDNQTGNLEFAIPSPEDAPEIESFCLEIFPTSYDRSWFAFMLTCDDIQKLCFRYYGQIVALLVGQVSKRDSQSAAVQVPSLSDEYEGDQSPVMAYIMLLGVSKPFRRYGLGSCLLQNFMITVNTGWPTVSRTFYLHVATDNFAAMDMYSGYGFRRMRLLPSYYNYSKDPSCPDLRDAFLYTKDVTRASECMDSLCQCIMYGRVGVVSLFSRMVSVVLSPVQIVFQVFKNCLSWKFRGPDARYEPAKVV